MEIFEKSITYTQESDCCSPKDLGQQLVVKTQNGGGGSYLVIETERWAIDKVEIDKFCKALKDLLKGIAE